MSSVVRPSPRPLSRGERGFYAELHCLSDFSFGRGASSAGELFERAQQQGYHALAMTDECSLAGIVRGLEASRATGLRMIVGSEITLDADGAAPLKLVLLVETREGYTTLCRLITQGRRRSTKGEYRLTRDDLADGLPGLLALWIPDARMSFEDGAWLRQRFDGRLWLAVELHRGADDMQRLRDLMALADALSIPAVASGDVHMHVRSRRALQDTMTAIRHRTTIAQAGKRLFPNGERHLRTRRALSAIHPAHLLEETLRIAERCRFSLETDLGYEYPRELVPDGHTPETWLRKLVEDGVRERWPEGESPGARALIEKELKLIRKMKYEPYFLTVHDIVRFARSKGILCQGRGSAANSVVCYTLGVTSIDPARMGLLFERFLSEERNEPPDIDIDFEHERREEVIQYIYKKYGRERAGMTAEVISYRGRSAVRDVGKAMGLSLDMVDSMAGKLDWWDRGVLSDAQLREVGLDPGDRTVRLVCGLAAQLLGFPRHLSQHTGGLVMTRGALCEMIPIENASMPDRTVIEWDKDDIDELG
ncbi:MAG TPA: PHP domain-containing protein, partial [Luteimonas sp.]|nr:PHP domain-containing protein [Luteimonas sp.]